MADALEFSKEYARLKQEFHNNACELFDTWIKESKIDVEGNRKKAEEYRKAQKDFDNLDKKVSRRKRRRGFLIFIIVVSFFLLALSIYTLYQTIKGSSTYMSDNIVLHYVLLPIVEALRIALIVIMVKIVNPKLKDAESLKEKTLKKVQGLFNSCNKQLLPLYHQYRDGATAELIQKTLPIIKLDSNFDMRRLDLLKNKYGMEDNIEENESTIGVFSGEILGNPFVEEKRLRQAWGKKIYSGSLPIHWTVTRRDAQGHVYIVHKSQILHASIEKPKPFYDTYTRLIYGNEGAPNLVFSHIASHIERLNDKERNKYILQFEKDLKKSERDAIKKGEEFTPLGNTEFEGLFNATDRNNEIEFRLLFTPLAQKNMVELLKMKEPFGDDFDFYKINMLNYIISEHAQSWEFDIDSSKFMQYDVDQCKEAFVEYNDNYFTNLYFEFAPLMSIPLYQQHKPHEYIYRDNYDRNYTSFEAEVLANALDESLLKDNRSVTQVILKTAIANKKGIQDEIMISAHSFCGEKRIEFVPVYGGDGRCHPVPVSWIEYVPIYKNTMATVVKNEKESNNAWNGSNAVMHNLRIDLCKTDTNKTDKNIKI